MAISRSFEFMGAQNRPHFGCAPMSQGIDGIFLRYKRSLSLCSKINPSFSQMWRGTRLSIHLKSGAPIDIPNTKSG
jgi:hypothetical protein